MHFDALPFLEVLIEGLVLIEIHRHGGDALEVEFIVVVEHLDVKWCRERGCGWGEMLREEVTEIGGEMGEEGVVDGKFLRGVRKDDL